MFCTIYDTNHWSNKISYMAKQFFNYIVNVLFSISWISSFHISKSSHQFKQRIQEGYGFLFVSRLLLGIDFYKEVTVYMHRWQATQNHSILRNILHWILDSVNQELPTICTKANTFNYEINIFSAKKKVSHLNLLGNIKSFQKWSYKISGLFLLSHCDELRIKGKSLKIFHKYPIKDRTKLSTVSLV